MYVSFGREACGDQRRSKNQKIDNQKKKKNMIESTTEVLIEFYCKN